MKRTLWVYFALLISVPCHAQWKFALWWGTPVYAFGAHDTTAFFMSTAPIDISDPHQVWIFVPNGITGKWGHADNGIDFTQGNVTSFASLGPYFFAGMTLRGGPGAAYRSSDDGQHWSLNGSWNVGTNGVYLFESSSTSVYRSKDSGNNWGGVPSPAASEFACIGNYIFARASAAIWRSTDTGNNWSQLSPPFVGTMMTMDSLLFITAGGNVIKSTDSGLHWSAVTVDSAGVPEKVNVLVASKGNLFAGTATGVLMSTDTGHTWRATNEGLTRSINVYAMGVFDTLLFVANNPGDSVFYRSIPEMVADTGLASVVEQLPPGDTIEVYPNPANGMVSIRAGGLSILGISVRNVLGVEVLDLPNPRESDITLDLSKLPSGTYFVRIETANGIILRKFIKE